MTSTYRLLSLLAASGCSFQGASGDRPDSAIPPDASLDGAADSQSNTCQTWTPFEGPNDPCASNLGTPVELVLDVDDATLDTGTGMLSLGGQLVELPGLVVTRVSGGNLRVVNLSRLVIGVDRTLTITGGMAPLMFVHGDVSIAGTLDASALPPAVAVGPAPGASSGLCANPVRSNGRKGDDATNNNRGGGGGGGAAFVDDGGDGGQGDGPIDGGNGGTKIILPTPFRGGCAGGRGGDDNDNGTNEGGLGGGGGGAIGISARGAINVDGTIRANGASGAGGGLRAGGGGGGSGGIIVLDGTAVTSGASSALCVNGGAGGEGGDDNSGQPGTPPTCSATPAPGGTGGADNGGDGGTGAAGVQAMGNPGNNANLGANPSGGGGGGGGGIGHIFVNQRAGQSLRDATGIHR